uniref:Cell growth regulator with EF-hand domain 1 n=1 Tax=Gasterosteus aculeatus aculeatus TaxID=481459 RepID=A0AAQ4NYG0_GASAC
KNGREKPPSHILRNTQASTLRARSARVTGSVGERTWRGGKPGERSAHTERRGPRKLADTTAAACFHVDPVIDPKHSGLRGRARVRACRRRCAVQTAVVTSRAVGGACDPEVFSRCEPRSADLPERKAFFCPRIFCADREESVNGLDPPVELANPFGSGDRRLLQSYIQSSLSDGQGGPEINTWEQEVFFLFGLYDYDRSGLLDGLEMMKLLSDYNSHHPPGTATNKLVVSMVDFLLQSQDVNQDGLLAPSELLSPAITHTQDSSINNAPQGDVAAEGKLSHPGPGEEQAGEAAPREEAHEKLQHQGEEQLEVQAEEDHVVDEPPGQQMPGPPAAEHGQGHKVPVHQGQPEM